MAPQVALVSFIKSLASFKGDLSTITAPPFLLSPISIIEFTGTWDDRPSLFVSPTFGKDPEQRALLVLQWFLSTLPRIIGRKDRVGVKKPLNPFLGELFLGHWDDEHGRTDLVIEQVGCEHFTPCFHAQQTIHTNGYASHHPPVSASCVTNKKHDITLQSYSGQKTSFSGSVDIVQSGHALLHLGQHNESYFITLCNMHIMGILSGNPYLELGGETKIYSSTGFTSHVEYAGKGWISGKKHRLTARMYRTDSPEDDLYTSNGQWCNDLVFKDVKNSTVVDSSHVQLAPRIPLTVAEVEDQDPWESRRAWSGVAKAIDSGNMRGTGIAKSLIENGQRKMRVDERNEGRVWQRRFFDNAGLEEFVKEVQEREELDMGLDRTLGVWRFDEEKAKKAERPFHGVLTPEGVEA